MALIRSLETQLTKPVILKTQYCDQQHVNNIDSSIIKVQFEILLCNPEIQPNCPNDKETKEATKGLR